MTDNASINLDIVTPDCINYIHDVMIRAYGGLKGVRDPNALGSALNRPQNRLCYDKSADIFDIAAEAGYGLINNHPFNDANKRTGAVTTLTLLKDNGFRIKGATTDLDLLDFFSKIAAGHTDVHQMATYLRNNSTPISARMKLLEMTFAKKHFFNRLASR